MVIQSADNLLVRDVNIVAAHTPLARMSFKGVVRHQELYLRSQSGVLFGSVGSGDRLGRMAVGQETILRKLTNGASN
jgi:hypothetical protein